MMKFLLIAAAVAACAFGAFILHRRARMNRYTEEMDVMRFERVKVLRDRLESGQEVTAQDVFPFAANLLTRELTYEVLKEHGKTDLFPAEYVSIVQGAACDLANWLEYPTELDACPDEVEHVKRVTVFGEAERHYYEVFRFRVREPHWAAKEGWILGVVGPYFDDSEPYDIPKATFSRFENEEGGPTPEEEAKWVHEHVYKRFH